MNERYSLPRIIRERQAGRAASNPFLEMRGEQAVDIRILTDEMFAEAESRPPYGLLTRTWLLRDSYSVIPYNTYLESLNHHIPLPEYFESTVLEPCAGHIRDTFIHHLHRRPQRHHNSIIGGIKTQADIISAVPMTIIKAFEARYNERPTMVDLRTWSYANTPFVIKLSNMYGNRFLALLDALRHYDGSTRGAFDLSALDINYDNAQIDLKDGWENLRTASGLRVGDVPVQHPVTGCPAGVHKKVFEQAAIDDYSAIEDMYFWYLDCVCPAR
jgi:hypothetical protein